MLSLGLEIAFAVLLITSIGYAIVLNRKLGNLRQHKEELERLAMTFSQSTIRAEDGVKRLKSSTAQMQNSIVKAQSIRDDLALLIDRGSLTADRLEQSVRDKRPQAIETKPSASSNALGSVDNVYDGVSASGETVVYSNERANKLNKKNKQGSPEEQKSQAEKDLIEALRQAR
jgi:hypothetical protein